ncbi:MAG: LPS export ABC transporter periplasmic protein LptC [Candidatus Omnitrophica bacterium]|nr:LPS export ABC transporter periplasmic protein LptC [Candidatus Omnitrophota bacterium]
MYLGFQGLRAAVQWLPLPAARAIGRFLGLVTYGLLGSQRRLTLRHLEFALSQELSSAQRRRVARGVFVNLGQNVMEWLLLPRLSTQQLQRLMTGEGVDHFRQALERGNGAIALTAHLGNWELIALYLKSLGFDGGVLARRLRYPEYESFLIGLRGARGVPTFARGSVRDVATLLRANQIIGILPDQDTESLDGIFVSFFNHPAYTPVGPAALSIMTGAPIVPCFLVREGATFRLVVEPPLRAPQTADRTQAMAALTQAWSDVVQSYIRRYPDQWVWMHRRWKTQPSATSDKRQATHDQQPLPRDATPQNPAWRQATSLGALRSVLAGCSVLLVACCLSLTSGCGRVPKAADLMGEPPAAEAVTPDPNATEQMSEFTLTGYEEDGSKRWQLSGRGASVDGNIVTIHHPDAIGFDPARTAYLTASAAQVEQSTRHIRMEHDVTIHTSDGLWFSAPLLHWVPDRNQMATDTSVRLETDHMLLRGRGLESSTVLNHATFLRDIEMVLNPSDHDLPGGQGPKQVTITCDGPLAFDYERQIATFEQNVHVQDPNGDLYSDKLVAYLDEKTHTIRYAEAIGRVRIHQNQNTALSERAIYEPAIGKITLVGRPSLLVYPSSSEGGTQLSFGGLATD